MKHGVMTTTKLSRLIRAGYGHGRGEEYKSWIRVRRHLHSTVSKLHVLRAPLYRRELHLLADTEWAAALIALWLGVREIREQRPAWPHEHAHPATGLHPDLDKQYDPVRGLLEIARDLGVDHGVYVGTHIPFVATIDLTLGVGPWHQRRLVDWSVKPRELLDAAPNRERMRERIALERGHSKEVGSTHVLIDGTQWPKDELVHNLDWFKPSFLEMNGRLDHSLIQEVAAAVLEVAECATIRQAVERAAQKIKKSVAVTDDYFRAAAWLGYVDLDFSKPIIMNNVMNRDDGRLKRRLRADLLGCVDV